MTLEEFKTCIETNSPLPKIVVCRCADETAEFVFHQYLDKYTKLNNLDVSHLLDLNSVTKQTLFGEMNFHTLGVFVTKELDMVQLPTQPVWIRCKKISSQAAELIKDYVIEIPKLEPWHITDYVYSMCEGLPKSELDYIISIHGKNLTRLENELQKIIIFENISSVYPQIKSQLFTDTSEYGIFDIINAIVRYDVKTLTKLLLEIDGIDIDPFGCLKLLLNNFNKIINVQLSRTVDANALGMTDKQLWAIRKYSCGIYTKNQLYEIYRFLTKCDYDIKSGYVPAVNMLDYIITNIMTIKERIV